jgi:hypothetical protein
MHYKVTYVVCRKDEVIQHMGEGGWLAMVLCCTLTGLSLPPLILHIYSSLRS